MGEPLSNVELLKVRPSEGNGWFILLVMIEVIEV